MDENRTQEKQLAALTDMVLGLQARVNRLEKEKYADWAGMLMEEYLCGREVDEHAGRTGE